MEIVTGIGVNGGIAIGQLSVYLRKSPEIIETRVDDANMEVLRFHEALEKAAAHLQELYRRAEAEVGEETALIFDVHRMMIMDPEYTSSVTEKIRNQKMSAESAVQKTAADLSNLFAVMDNEYMKARAADITDVSDKVLGFLRGTNDYMVRSSHPGILSADDLVPSETIQLDRSKILGFITEKGSSNSHTTILARMMDIPAIVGTGTTLGHEHDGKLAILDGYEGKLYLEPDQETLLLLSDIRDRDSQQKKQLEQLKGQKSITRDGRKINLYANIGSPEDVKAVIDNDAEGIGLFRSEFLFLNCDTYPTEEEQFKAYRTVAEKMAGKRVIIRTLDIGADKKIDYFNLEPEDNPALGYRAIRICLDRKELFITQLRAIYRASVYGRIAIMFPMIISLEEVGRIKAILQEVRNSLLQEGLPFVECELGIMIETPAAAVISDLLAEEVDFFSIGTNDLTQYTLAIDRQNRKLDNLYDAHHPAILRMISMVTQAAHARGKWVGICGELASELSLTRTFLDMGIDELSVSPAKILELRNEIIQL